MEEQTRDVAAAGSGEMSAASKEASWFCLGCKCPGHCPCCPGWDISDSRLPGALSWLMAPEVLPPFMKFHALAREGLKTP